MQSHFGLSYRPARVRMASANGETVPIRRVFPQPASLGVAENRVKLRQVVMLLPGYLGAENFESEDSQMKHAFCTSTRLALIGLLLTSFATAAAPAYHVIKTFKLGGEAGWDHLP